MNKVTLVKSFAGYPVWEYELEWNYYSMEKDLQSSWPTKYHQIHKDIVERFKDYFEEIKERPTSWLVKRSKLLEFDTEEKCSHFYKHHSDLISKLAPFYIF